MSQSPKKNNYTKFYLTRHGETQWNIEKIIQGHLDSPLTNKGIRQAKEAASKLKDIKFDYAFSSDLFRAQRTAQIIAADRDLAIKTSKLLRESAFGPFEGKKVAFLQNSLKKAMDYRETLSNDEQMEYKIHPEVESYEELAARMLAFFKQAAVAYPGKNVLAVSHSGAIRATLVKLGFATNQELPHDPYTIPNASYAVIESDGVEFFVGDTVGIKKTP